jgi:hypothetical protein
MPWRGGRGLHHLLWAKVGRENKKQPRFPARCSLPLATSDAVAQCRSSTVATPVETFLPVSDDAMDASNGRQAFARQAAIRS